MVFSAVILSAGFLLGINAVARTKVTYLPTIVCCVVAAIFVPISPVVGLQATLTLVAWLGWQFTQRKPKTFLGLTIGATAVAYLVVGVSAWQEQHEYDRLRTKYAYSSMEERVPAPKRSAPLEQLPASSVNNLTNLESRIGDSSSARNFLLKRLHHSTVATFIDSPGFGVRRIIRPTDERLERRDLTFLSKPVAQPGEHTQVYASFGDLEKVEFTGDREALNDLHHQSITNFASPGDFGFIKDRKNVAGFLPHQMSETPWSKTLKVETIDLVSLLLHDPPMAYVSKNLPRMEELIDAPLRSLDAFESVGMTRLERGQDLFVYVNKDMVRMLGGIRAAKQCVKCHGCNRGDLLGAFAYTLKLEKK